MARFAQRLTLLIACVAGCSHARDGDIRSLTAAPTTQESRSATRLGDVYILRGWVGLYSEGIDQLTNEIQAKGIDANVFAVEQSSELGDALLKKYAGRAKPGPIVLIGFSYGANDVITLTRKLDLAQVNVDLLVTIDPVTPSPIPASVGRCYNLYQSNGVWDAFPWLRGVPVKAEQDGQTNVTNIDIRKTDELLEPNTSHSTIAANAKVHKAVIDQVLAVCPEIPGATTRTTMANTTK